MSPSPPYNTKLIEINQDYRYYQKLIKGKYLIRINNDYIFDKYYLEAKIGFPWRIMKEKN